MRQNINNEHDNIVVGYTHPPRIFRNTDVPGVIPGHYDNGNATHAPVSVPADAILPHVVTVSYPEPAHRPEPPKQAGKSLCKCQHNLPRPELPEPCGCPPIPRPLPPKPEPPVPCNCPPRTYRNPPDVIVKAGDNVTVDTTVEQDLTTYTVNASSAPIKVDPDTMYGDGITVPIGVHEYDGNKPGLVPDPPDDGKGDKYLRADGTWSFIEHPVDQELDPESENAVSNKAVCAGLSAMDGKADKVPNATGGNFAGLDTNGNLTDSGYNASNFKIKQTPLTKAGATNKTITSITQNANGEFDATFGEIQSATTDQKGVVQLADAIGPVVEIENNRVATEKAVRDAIDDSLDATIKTLDVDEVGGSGKYISAISETDGKISATATSMDTAPAPNSTKAITSGGVFSAIASLDSSVTGSSTNVTVTVVEAGGKLAAIEITDSAAASDHAHGNISNDGKIGTDTNKVLVTTTGGTVVAGAIEGTYNSDTNKIATQTTVSNAILRMRYANTNTLRFYRGV